MTDDGGVAACRRFIDEAWFHGVTENYRQELAENLAKQIGRVARVAYERTLEKHGIKVKE